MRLRTPTVRLQLALLLAGCFDLWGCQWRKPLPVTRDAGPLVEVVEPPRPKPTAGPDTAATALAEEREPNDGPELAQELAPPPGSPAGQGYGVRGSLAAPTAQAAGKGDDDAYSLSLPMEPQLLRAELSTGPRADVSLELLDEQGKRIALIDERGRGEGERLGNLLFGPSQRVHLRVRGSVAGLTDAADAAYRLLIVPAAAPSGSEREPNDTALTATPVTGTVLAGSLAWRRDEDVWVIGLAEAMGRRPQPGAPPSGLTSDAVLRVELDAPGVLPTLKVQIEAATAAAPPAVADGGAAAPQLVTAVDLSAASAGELRLRNVGIPAGSTRAYVTVRAASFQKPPGAERYHLRLSVEPALEAAEVEPNDDCARATALAVTDGEDQIRGFLWPGDVDCYRLKPPSPAMHRWKLQLSVPADECKASLELVRAEGGKAAAEPATKATLGAPGTGGAASPLALRARGEVLVRVTGQRRSTCFREPYRLSVQVEPDGGGPP